MRICARIALPMSSELYDHFDGCNAAANQMKTVYSRMQVDWREGVILDVALGFLSLPLSARTTDCMDWVGMSAPVRGQMASESSECEGLCVRACMGRISVCMSMRVW